MASATGIPPVNRNRGPDNGAGYRRLGLGIFTVVSLMLFGLASVVSWRWTSQNLLQWGIKQGQVTAVDHAELLRRVRAFEMATIKQTYRARANVESAAVLNAGPKRITLPGFVAGEEMRAEARVTVTAGVDMSRIRASDMEIVRDGAETRVIVRTPSPEILSTEIEPGSFDISTRTGFITGIQQAAGRQEHDLRDRAVDAVTDVARETAIEQGILTESQRETERRLQAFLQSLPQPGDQRVTYVVITRDPVLQ